MSIDILRIGDDRFLEMEGGLPEVALLRQQVPQIVVRFRQIGFNADGLAEFRFSASWIGGAQLHQPRRLWAAGRSGLIPIAF